MTGAAAAGTRGINSRQGSMHVADQQHGRQVASHRDSGRGVRAAVTVRTTIRAYTKLTEAADRVVRRQQTGGKGGVRVRVRFSSTLFLTVTSEYNRIPLY